MTSDTFFMKGRQQRNRNLFGQSFFVASRALAPLALVPVAEDIEIMVADSAADLGFVQIMVKGHKMLMVFAELLAF